jgi:hypothetical protein
MSSSEPQFKLREQPDFVGLPELAERLGIKPNEGSGALWLSMKDGRKYDVFALANAFLDKLTPTLT